MELSNLVGYGLAGVGTLLFAMSPYGINATQPETQTPSEPTTIPPVPVVKALPPDINGLYSQVRQIVRRHYPEATFHQLNDKIYFEHDTRIFVIHEPLKTGEWQAPSEERGPKIHGILGDIEIRPGKYQGAALVPQSFDKRYFTVYLMAPYSERLDAHLYIHIKYPRRVSEGFLKQLTEVLNDFEKYVASYAG